jgi:hypothetical protein
MPSSDHALLPGVLGARHMSKEAKIRRHCIWDCNDGDIVSDAKLSGINVRALQSLCMRRHWA